MEQAQSGKTEHKQKGGGRFEKIRRAAAHGERKKLGGNRKKEAPGLKYLKWVSWGTLLGCAVVLCALGFAAGRLTAPKPEAAQPQSTELSAEVPKNTPEGVSQSAQTAPDPAESALLEEQPERETQPAEAAQNPVLPQYLLRRSGEQLVILQGETVLTAFSPDWTQVPKEEQSLLETGIPFETLAQIESYLEGYEG